MDEFVLVRGTQNTIGSDLGKMYKYGVFIRATNYAKKLNVVQDGGWVFFQNPNKLGLSHKQYLSSNPIYTNRSNFGVFRLYNRSLTDEEIMNNFNSEAKRYGITNNSYETQPIQSGLICHLDAGDTKSYPGIGNIWYDISPLQPIENSSMNDPILLMDGISQKNINTNANVNNLLRHLQNQGLNMNPNLKYTVPKRKCNTNNKSLVV